MPRPVKDNDELRERGVRLVFESGRPIAHVARDLGVHRETLRLWVRQAEADQGLRQDRLTTQERERLKDLERENRGVASRERDPEGGEFSFRRGARSDPAEAVSFIDAHRARFGVEPICRVFQIASSTYSRARSRPPSRRALEDARLLGRIRDVHASNDAAYESRRTWKTLRRQGVDVGRGRVKRVMRQHGCRARSARPRAGG